LSEGPRYSFAPLERRGVLIGLSGGQLATIAGALIVALVAHHALPPPAGTPVAAATALAGAAAALWSREGRPAAAWVPLAGAWLVRRRGGGEVSPEPLGGGREGPALVPAGIRLVVDRAGPDGTDLGVVVDRAGTVAAVVPVAGRSFSLLDSGEQAQQLEAWRAVMGALARPGTPVARLQWVARTGRPSTAVLDLDGGAEARTPPGESYRELVGSALPRLGSRQSWLVVVVDRGSRRGIGRHRGLDVLRRELRLVEGQLRAAGLEPGAALGGRELAAALAGGYRCRTGAGPSRPWPLGADDGWSSYRTDDSWHVTYWVAEWPRVEVGPAFLLPLLCAPGRVAVSVVMAPVPADRALREVRSARTADLADAELRHRAGFLPAARRQREAEGADQREAELADGHSEFRFSGYVTASAADPEGLVSTCAAVEHAAQAARLELRRLYGRQAEAFSWTLPLGRGLR
jgi:hypothetical protein